MFHVIHEDLARNHVQQLELSRRQGKNRRSLEIAMRARREARRLNNR
ncbi:MAG TPA: hypothetical protein VFL99_17110 [Segeticoccus sp.]|nr:hypothetical protein [Segeticoccus sp.]HET8602048.1 hypothetical protein [Segeticoccus sp.]